MTPLQKIQTYLQDKDLAEVVELLGYKTSKSAKITQTLSELLNATQMSDYLDKSYFDFRYDSRTLLKAICKLAGVSKLDIALTIEEYEDRKRRVEAFETPYIFVYTNFKRKGQPIFALAALEHTRRVKLDKELYLSQSEEEINAQISNTVKLHFKMRNGKLPMWGEIKVYLYYDVNGKRTVYSQLGEIIEDDDVQESLAIIKN